MPPKSILKPQRAAAPVAGSARRNPVTVGSTEIKKFGESDSDPSSAETEEEEDSDIPSDSAEDDSGDDDDSDGNDSSGDDDEDDEPDSDLEDQNDEAIRAAFTDDNLSALQDQLSMLEKQDDAALFSAKQALSDEARKALHVSNQQRLWKTSLSLRLQLQTPAALAQRLPPPNLLSLARGAGSVPASALPSAETIHKKASIAAAVTAQALSDLIEYQRALSRVRGDDLSPWTAPELLAGLTAKARVKHEKRFREDAAGVHGEAGVARAKRARTAAGSTATAVDADLADIEAYLSSEWDAGAKRRDAILDKWHKRVSIATGRADLGTDGGRGAKNKNSSDASGAGLSLGGGLSQPLSAQVRHVLSVDEDRLMQRTRMRRGSKRSLCEKHEEARRDNEDDDAYNARMRMQMFDDNIFDDADFFSTLLRELTSLAGEAGTGAAGVAGSLAASIAAQQAALRETKDSVARKRDNASKGRKISYALIPKLANFMVPIYSPQWVAACASTSAGDVVGDAHEVLVDELLQGLFGQGTRTDAAVETAAGRVGEDDVDSDSDSEEEDEDDETGSDEESDEGGEVNYGDNDEELYGDFEVIGD